MAGYDTISHDPTGDGHAERSPDSADAGLRRPAGRAGRLCQPERGDAQADGGEGRRGLLGAEGGSGGADAPSEAGETIAFDPRAWEPDAFK